MSSAMVSPPPLQWMVSDGQLYDGQAVHPVGAPEIIHLPGFGFGFETMREPPPAAAAPPRRLDTYLYFTNVG